MSATSLPIAIPDGAISPAKPRARSHLDAAMRDMVNWPRDDQTLFVITFTTGKSGSQIAAELGLSQHGFLIRKRAMLRRFMRAAKPARDDAGNGPLPDADE